MRAGRDPADKDASHEQNGLVADGQTSNDVARLLEAFHLPIGRVPVAAEGHDRGGARHGARGSQSSAQHLRHRTQDAIRAVVLGPVDALQELEAQAQSGFGFKIFVQVRLGEQQQSFAVDAFRGEVLDKRLRRAEPREKSSYLFAGPRVGVVGQPRRRIVEGASSPTLRRRRRGRDATRRAGVSRAASAGHFCVLLLPRGAAAPARPALMGRPLPVLLTAAPPARRSARLPQRATRLPVANALRPARTYIGAYRLVRCSGQSWHFLLVPYNR